MLNQFLHDIAIHPMQSIRLKRLVMAPRVQPINSTGKPCNKRANALMIGDSHKRGSTKSPRTKSSKQGRAVYCLWRHLPNQFVSWIGQFGNRAWEQSPPNKAVQFTVCDDIYPTSLSPGLVDLVIEHGHADVLFDTQWRRLTAMVSI